MDEKLVLLLMVLNDDEIEQRPNIFDSTGKRFWKEERELDQLWYWVSDKCNNSSYIQLKKLVKLIQLIKHYEKSRKMCSKFVLSIC